MGMLADLPGAWRREEGRDGVSWHYPHNRQGRPGGQIITFRILLTLISSRFWKQKEEQEEEEELEEFRLLFVQLCLASWWHPLFWGCSLCPIVFICLLWHLYYCFKLFSSLFISPLIFRFASLAVSHQNTIPLFFVFLSFVIWLYDCITDMVRLSHHFFFYFFLFCFSFGLLFTLFYLIRWLSRSYGVSSYQSCSQTWSAIRCFLERSGWHCLCKTALPWWWIACRHVRCNPEEKTDETDKFSDIDNRPVCAPTSTSASLLPHVHPSLLLLLKAVRSGIMK